MSENQNQPITLTSVIAAAMKLPGIRVDREAFLREQFKDEDPVAMNTILAVGPVAAGFDRDRLRRKADGVILATTLMSTGASFLAGLPGGLALAVTIPTDLLQYYGAALKMAQEIAYLYGEPDLWKGSLPDDEAVTNQLILYIGVMLGATGAAPAVRLSASAFAQRLLKKRPQNPSTDTYTYPVVKSVLRFFAKTITKTSLAKGVTKVIPVIGGLVSGGITFASLKPMAARLQEALDKAHFSYSDIDIANDLRAVEEESARMAAEEDRTEPEKLPEGTAEQAAEPVPAAPAQAAPAIDYDGIRKAKELLDEGIIDEREFAAIKARIITGK